MTKEWLGYDKKSRNIKNIYVGINGKARKVAAAYVGVNGKARKAYPIIPIPTASGEYTYDGTTKEAVITNFDSNYVSVSGVSSAINAGIYTVTFSLTDTNAVWEDGTKKSISYLWEIKKCTQTKIILTKVTGTQTGGQGNWQKISYPTYTYSFRLYFGNSGEYTDVKANINWEIYDSHGNKVEGNPYSALYPNDGVQIVYINSYQFQISLGYRGCGAEASGNAYLWPVERTEGYYFVKLDIDVPETDNYSGTSLELTGVNKFQYGYYYYHSVTSTWNFLDEVATVNIEVN